MYSRQIDNFSRRAIQFYHRWDALEKDLREGIGILDFDLSPRECTDVLGRAFGDRKEALREIDQIRSTLAGMPDETLVNKEFLEAKFRGSWTLLRHLTGESVSFSELLNDCMGIEPVRRSDSELKQCRQNIFEEFHYLGLDPTKLTPLELKQAVADPYSRLEESLPRTAEHWVAETKKALRLDCDATYEIEVVEEDSYWLNWITAEFGRPARLKVNNHPRRIHRRGDDQYYASHEIAGHALHVACLQKEIQADRLDIAGLSLTVHNCEQFLIEGIATSM